MSLWYFLLLTRSFFERFRQLFGRVTRDSSPTVNPEIFAMVLFSRKCNLREMAKALSFIM